MLAGQQASLWEDAARLLVCTLCNDGSVRTLLHQVEHLSIAEEEHDTGLHHVLEDEVLVIVADFIDVAHDEVIEGRLPLGR